MHATKMSVYKSFSGKILRKTRRISSLLITWSYFLPYSGYQSHAPSNDFFSISKTTFWWTSIKCLHDNNGVKFSEYPSCSFISSLLDSSINRNWEVRLIKSFEAPFRSSRSRAMLWSYKFTNIVQPQQHENELNININFITEWTTKV